MPRDNRSTRQQRRRPRQGQEYPTGDRRNEERRPRRRRRQSKRRVESLDGIRAIAIIAVMLYHLSVPWLPSGHLGVVLFLVLSGYLVSGSVLRTMRRDGSVSYLRLWGHRIGRIWPSMAVMVFFAVAMCTLFNHVLLFKLRPDLVPSLLLANNLGAILRGASYFDNLGGTSPLMHLWYLGVDFQFFVIWTLLASTMCPKGRSTRLARRTALVLALVSAVLMAVLYDPNGDPTRVYYGPDTRAFAPLLGAWLGLAWPLGGRPVRLTRDRLTVRSLPLAIAGPVALILLVVIMVLAPATSPFLYRGGMLLAALLSVLLVAGSLDRRQPLAQLLSCAPLKWLGARSFGLYLWHFPLFQLFKVTEADTSPLLVILAIVLSFVAAEASLRLIEQPIAQDRFPLVVGSFGAALRGGIEYLRLLPAVLTLAALITGIVGLVIVPEETAVPTEAIASTGAGAAEAMDLTDRLEGQNATDEAEDEEESTDEASEKTDEELPSGSIYLIPSKKLDSDGKFTPVIIADSVAGSTDWYIADHIPDALLDSFVGRRPDQALEVLKTYLSQGIVGDIVILDSFSNMTASDDLLDQMVETCGKRSVYLINVRIPNAEREQINDSLARCAKRHKNVTLIDWYATSEGHPEWLYDDGTHLRPDGQGPYIDMIANAIKGDYAKLGGEVLSEDAYAEEEDEEEASETAVETDAVTEEVETGMQTETTA